MKNLSVMFLIIVTSLALFSCSKDNPAAPELKQDPEIGQIPESSQSNLFPNPLTIKNLACFSGTSTNTGVINPGVTKTLSNGTVQIRGLVVKTEDEMTDPRVSGVVTWVVNMNIYQQGNDIRWGTGELIVPNGGKWKMEYVGWKTSKQGIWEIRYEVWGRGNDGLSGLKAHWTYILPNPPGIFDVHGYIIGH